MGFAQVGAESGWRTANTKNIQESAVAAGIELKFSEMAPAVAALLARLLGRDEAWAAQEVARFRDLAAQYLLQKVATATAA